MELFDSLGVAIEQEPDEETVQGQNYSEWLSKARDAYEESTSYVDNNYRQQWENNIRHWQGRHHSDSKYYTESFKYRSKIFRPKTRSAIRNNEAAAVAAFFANQDVVNIEPENERDPKQKASAEIMYEVMQYRLTKTIPWFLLCIGAFQETMVTGVVASYQAWEYEQEENIPEPPPLEEVSYESGNALEYAPSPPKVKKDRPTIKLIPVENVRLHPASDWTNPVESSPYLIIRWPMFVCDVKQRMKDVDPKTGYPKWKELDDGQIKTALDSDNDSTRSTRNQERTDPTEEAGGASLNDFQVVWCHENFIKQDGTDFVYWTLSTSHMLTDPTPLEEVYFHGIRPIVMGNCVIEAHKVYPSGLGQIGEGIQKEMNEIANQRLDNVKLVLNKRWIARRGANVDLLSVTRNVAGSVTLADNLDDVRPVEFHDVTGSSYQEQDRLNVDYDEVVGTFSASTIQTSRKLNETVGGMQMLRGGVNSLVEYVIRTFAETWVEPVLTQLVKLEQAYETDTVVLALAAEKAQLIQRYGVDTITDDLLNQQLTLSVNVGMGATDPMTKMQNFGQAVAVISGVAASPAAPMFKIEEVAKEAFGRVGYKDGARFLKPEGQQPDPEKMQMQQALQQMQQQMQQMQIQLNDKTADRQHKENVVQFQEANENKRFAAELQAKFGMKTMDMEQEHLDRLERMAAPRAESN